MGCEMSQPASASVRLAAWLCLLFAQVVGLTTSAACAAESGPNLYRWIDDQGNVHYTDQVPPSQSKQGHTRLSEDGLRTDVVPPALTGEELKKADEEQRRKAEENRRREAERVADLRLLQTYRTVDELVLAREGRIAGIEASIRVKRDLLRREQDQLVKSATERRNTVRAGKPIPDKLGSDIEQSQHKIREGYAAVIGLELDKDSVRQEFATTMQKFKRLKKISDAEPSDKGSDAPPIPNMISCQGMDQCRSLWERASAYLRAHSDKDNEISGGGLLIGFQKDQREDRRLTLSWTQKSPTEPVNIFFDLQCKNRLTASLVCTDPKAIETRETFRSAVLQSNTGGTPAP